VSILAEAKRGVLTTFILLRLGYAERGHAMASFTLSGIRPRTAKKYEGGRWS